MKNGPSCATMRNASISLMHCSHREGSQSFPGRVVWPTTYDAVLALVHRLIAFWWQGGDVQVAIERRLLDKVTGTSALADPLGFQDAIAYPMSDGVIIHAQQSRDLCNCVANLFHI